MLRISLHVLKLIKNTVGSTYAETGGLLGQKKEGEITFFSFDQCASQHMNCYTPDICWMNAQISDWYRRRITFVGIIHSHRENQCTKLSYADVMVARKIIDFNRLEFIYMPIYMLETNTIIFYKVNAMGGIEKIEWKS